MHLLVPPLHRAITLVQVHDAAVVVCQYLDLYVARVLDQLLHKHGPIAEGSLRLLCGSLECVFKLLLCNVSETVVNRECVLHREDLLSNGAIFS